MRAAVLFVITAALLAALISPSVATSQLVARGEETGIRFQHVYGGADKKYISEMGGSGAAWLDYDVDGRMDLFLVNGLEGPADHPGEATAAHLTRSSLAPGSDRARSETTVASSSPQGGHRLFRNNQGLFEEVPGAAGAGDKVWGNGLAAGDVDNDGFVDIYVTAIGQNRLYRNNGDGTFAPWIAGVEDSRWGTSAVFTDWDADGNLDLYVANYVTLEPQANVSLDELVCRYEFTGARVMCGPRGLVGDRDVFYRNQGDGTFEAWPETEVDPEATYGFALVATDCDGDRRPDIYVATDTTMNLLYRNGPTGLPQDSSLVSGAGFSGSGLAQAGMGATAGDYDRDGDFDLFVTNFQFDNNTLYRNRGDCGFEDVTEPSGLGAPTVPYMGWAAVFFDFDGDADQDLYVANGNIYPQVDDADVETYKQHDLLFLNQLSETGLPHFIKAREGSGGGPGMELLDVSRSTAIADHDNDGDFDLLVTNLNGSPTLLTNEGRMRWPSLRLTLVGRDGNRSGYGARVVVEAAGVRQSFESRHSDGYLGSNDPRLLVFLPGGRADRIEIDWPGGSSMLLSNEPPGWLVLHEERGVIARRNP